MKSIASAGLACALVATTSSAVFWADSASADGVQQLRWATSAVGSAGHRAKVNLATVINREMDRFDITVMPTPGGIATIRGYAMNDFDGLYGADIAFNELANNTGRFEGFRDRMQREPVQSFWAFTMEVGLGVAADDVAGMSGWGDLSGEPVFTGPAPWDVRAQLERAMNTLEVGHVYRELDLGLAGSSLETGTIRAFNAYTAGEAGVAPWVSEAMLATDVAMLNLSADEQARLADAGIGVVELDASLFTNAHHHADTVTLVPFFYGFHVGPDVSEEDKYQMLITIEAHADELAEVDSVFAQLANGGMAELQRRGVASAVNDVRVHPGLARFMRERGVWNSDWDDRVL